MNRNTRHSTRLEQQSLPAAEQATRGSTVPERFTAGSGWWALPLIAACVSLAYANGIRGDFVYDDRCDIVDCWRLRRVGPIWSPIVEWSDGQIMAHPRPVAVYTFALNYAVGGLQSTGFHVTNLAIHVLATFALFGLLRRTFTLPRLPRFHAVATPLALLIALAWGLHPLETQAVTYIVQRDESLMGMFFLFALYAALRGHKPSAAILDKPECCGGLAGAGVQRKRCLLAAGRSSLRPHFLGELLSQRAAIALAATCRTIRILACILPVFQNIFRRRQFEQSIWRLSSANQLSRLRPERAGRHQCAICGSAFGPWGSASITIGRWPTAAWRFCRPSRWSRACWSQRYGWWLKRRPGAFWAPASF